MTVAAAVLGVVRTPVAAAPVPFAGVGIGGSIAAVAGSLGSPVLVVSEDRGHRFAFANGTTAWTDDDGRVLAAETQSGAPTVEVDGVSRTLRIGAYTADRAEAELGDVAEFSRPDRRSYRLDPQRDLVLAFGPDGRLARIVFGEPGQLVRLGLLPGDPAARAVAYRAPQPREPSPASRTAAAGTAATVFRVSVDRTGAVTDVAVEIAAAGAGDPTAQATRLRAQRYRPAALDGRPIAATVFVAARS